MGLENITHEDKESIQAKNGLLEKFGIFINK